MARAQAYTIYSCRTSLLKLALGKKFSSFVASSLGCVCSALGRGVIKINSCSGSEAVEGALKLARQVCIRFGIVGCEFNVLSSTGMNRSSPKAKKKSFLGTFPTTGTRLLHFLGRDTRQAATHTIKLTITRTFAKCQQPTQSAFRYAEETEEQYVERLRQQLEDRFLELGPDTVIRCKPSPTLTGNS